MTTIQLQQQSPRQRTQPTQLEATMPKQRPQGQGQPQSQGGDLTQAQALLYQQHTKSATTGQPQREGAQLLPAANTDGAQLQLMEFTEPVPCLQHTGSTTIGNPQREASQTPPPGQLHKPSEVAMAPPKVDTMQNTPVAACSEPCRQGAEDPQQQAERQRRQVENALMGQLIGEGTQVLLPAIADGTQLMLAAGHHQPRLAADTGGPGPHLLQTESTMSLPSPQGDQLYKRPVESMAPIKEDSRLHPPPLPANAGGSHLLLTKSTMPLPCPQGGHLCQLPAEARASLKEDTRLCPPLLATKTGGSQLELTESTKPLPCPAPPEPLSRGDDAQRQQAVSAQQTQLLLGATTRSVPRPQEGQCQRPPAAITGPVSRPPGGQLQRPPAETTAPRSNRTVNEQLRPGELVVLEGTQVTGISSQCGRQCQDWSERPGSARGSAEDKQAAVGPEVVAAKGAESGTTTITPHNKLLRSPTMPKQPSGVNKIQRYVYLQNMARRLKNLFPKESSFNTHRQQHPRAENVQPRFPVPQSRQADQVDQAVVSLVQLPGLTQGQSQDGQTQAQMRQLTNTDTYKLQQGPMPTTTSKCLESKSRRKSNYKKLWPCEGRGIGIGYGQQN
ncbi:hypothetical protein CBR_g19041 [Chara braunii]|uniref:Uncharacterized protein n=1 Tax=Chara braunii TaxID=69332 RepID=A0A388KX50_CHABU|nr:hypothetical protein CBR_g19041 [Chara braunii]|eukprot:GBG74634.1 hypothetical protein CBR_g19041 [Chara braunii]